MHVTDACDLSRRQSALSALEDWERLWQLSVSSSKCCVLSVDKKVLDDSSLKFRIDGSTLQVVNFCVDLGITISSVCHSSLFYFTKCRNPYLCIYCLC